MRPVGGRTGTTATCGPSALPPSGLPLFKPGEALPKPNPVYPMFGRILLQAVISNMLDYQGANQQPQDKPDWLGLTMAFAHPEFLVSTDWLAERLADDDVRVFETTIFLHPRDGDVRRIESGRREYEAGHIPGSGFLDLQADFSDNGQPWCFMMPSAGAFAEAAGRHLGVVKTGPLRPPGLAVGGEAVVDVPLNGLRGRGRAGRPRAVLFRPTRPRLSPRRPIRRASLTLPRLGRTSSWEMGAGAA